MRSLIASVRVTRVSGHSCALKVYAMVQTESGCSPAIEWSATPRARNMTERVLVRSSGDTPDGEIWGTHSVALDILSSVKSKSQKRLRPPALPLPASCQSSVPPPAEIPAHWLGVNIQLSCGATLVAWMMIALFDALAISGLPLSLAHTIGVVVNVG